MSQKTDAVVACTIGIDTAKNTLHLIGLDDRGAIVLREKLTRGRIAARLANGIGPIIASAMVAAVGSGTAFAKGRDFAAWLGLVPKQMSTGDRTILGRSASAAIATRPRRSCRAPELFCSDRQTRQSIALDRGSRLR